MRRDGRGSADAARPRYLLAGAAVGIALAVLAPVVLWGAVVQGTVVGDIARHEAEQRLLTAQLASAAIDRTLVEAGSRLELVAARTTLHAALRDRDRAGLEGMLAEVADPDEYASASVFDPAGIMLARAPGSPELYGQSFADSDYYAGAIASSGPFVSEVYASRGAGDPTFVAVAVAARVNGATLGVTQLTIRSTRFLELLEPLRSVAGRELHVVDEHGHLVANTDPALAPMSEVALPGLEQALADETGSRTAVVAGRERVVTFAPIRTARWALFVSDDPSVVGGAQRRLEEQLALGAAATTLLAIGAAVGIAWLYAASLRQRAALALREAALQRANVELEAASRHKSDFLAGMSHELRTPLNAILGFSDLLREQLVDVLSDRQERYLRNIRDAGDHLLGLINDVLDLSKVEAGRIELRPEQATIASLLDPIVLSTRAEADAKGLEFRMDAPAAGMVAADPGRFRQILYNLLSNAVKFTPRGGAVRLGVAIDGRDLWIEVADTGIGIPAEKLDRVFGTFERLHEARRDISGTGLGLALTKKLVELHGGDIQVTSEEGKGTTFRVRLPDLVASAVPRHRLLVVEDDRRDADLIVALAAESGLESEVAGSVFAALASIRRSKPVAVVVDLRLPDGRGEAILEALRTGRATRHVPAIVVTVEDEDARSLALGADDHLTKPIDRARLKRWLARVAAPGRRTEVPHATAAGR